MPRDQWKDELREIAQSIAGRSPYMEQFAYDRMLEVAEAAFKRGHEAGSSRAGYRLVQENERLRRELEQARRGADLMVCHNCKRVQCICREAL